MTTEPSRRVPGLPGLVLAALYLVLVAAPLLLALATGEEPDAAWREAASALGLAALAMMALQFATSGRFEALSGRIGIDRTMGFHKWAARLLLLALVLHPLLYAVPAALADPARGLAVIERMVTSERLRSGVVAWVAILALVGLAVLRERVAFTYEIWRASHALLAILALVAGIHHAIVSGVYSETTALQTFWIVLAVAAIGSLAVVYVGRTRLYTRDVWRLVELRRVGTGLWELAFRRESGEAFGYRAGQFVWLATAPRRFPLFDHPFSIASSPRERDLRLVIKEVGDYTRTIPSWEIGLAAGMDGPHGAFYEEGREASALVLCAGGVGVAPILGVLRDLAARGERRPVRVLLAAGRPDKLVGLDEIAGMAERLDLRVLAMVEEAGEGAREGVAIGRPEPARLESLLEGIEPGNALAMICGPGPFTAAIADGLLAIGLRRDAVLYERFDYAEEGLSRIDRAERLRFRLIGAVAIAAALAFALR